MRENFKRKSAEFAALVRALVPTWIPYEKKLKSLSNPEGWKRYVDEIYQEYRYQGRFTQSPKDCRDASGEKMIAMVKKYLSLRTFSLVMPLSIN